MVFGSDHAGYILKEVLKEYAAKLGYTVEDVGAWNAEPTDDYPDFVIPAAEAVAKSKGKKRGVVLGGSGIGECIAANKVKGIRAGLIYDSFTATKSREHDDTNIACFGGRTVTKDPAYAKKLLKVWLETPFSGDQRHLRRLKKISRYEQ